VPLTLIEQITLGPDLRPVSHEEILGCGGRIHLGCRERRAGRPRCARRHPVHLGFGESGWHERLHGRSSLAGIAPGSFGPGMVDGSEP